MVEPHHKREKESVECVSKNITQHRKGKTHKIFRWKSKSEKIKGRRRRIHYNPLVARFTEIMSES